MRYYLDKPFTAYVSLKCFTCVLTVYPVMRFVLGYKSLEIIQIKRIYSVVSTTCNNVNYSARWATLKNLINKNL